MQCRTLCNTFETEVCPDPPLAHRPNLRLLDAGLPTLPGMDSLLIAACFEAFSLSVWMALELVDALLYLPGRWNT